MNKLKVEIINIGGVTARKNGFVYYFREVRIGRQNEKLKGKGSTGRSVITGTYSSWWDKAVEELEQISETEKDTLEIRHKPFTSNFQIILKKEETK